VRQGGPAKPRAAPKARNAAAPQPAADVPIADFPIVGIGMSAGGLEFATAFLSAMRPDSGMAFVIVQHLEPTRDSMLADLLGRATAMPVMQIEDGMQVAPNHVYVIVPAKTLTIQGGRLRLTEPDEPRGQRHPIDRFFSALALDRQAKAIAIVLSGSGSNGTAGLQDIRQAGGLCIAQDPGTATFDSMPRHAIASGAVDLVLAAERMPDALLNYLRHPYLGAGAADASGPHEPAADAAATLDSVLTLLRARAGFDFRLYKRSTLSRRIQRRMSLAGIAGMDGYVALLRRDPAELEALGRDIMINVTALFRDPDAWDALDREVVTPLVGNVSHDQPIRVWVPACSTGEEAYTIAMLFAERGDAHGKRPNVKIFATDPAEANLARARKGLFVGSMVESLSRERLARFFTKGDDDTYRVKPEIRETVLFASQNLLKDPPYSRMDLVSCRNLLIYLEPEAQNRVLALAHFALRDRGCLFLGSAETIGPREHLFATVSKRWRIWRRIGSARAAGVDFGLPQRDDAQHRPKPAEIAVKVLAERFAPASVLIDRSYHILHFHGPTDTYLAQPDGAPTVDLLALARPGLRATIHGAVGRAIAEAAPVTLATRGGAKAGRVSVTASPVRGDAAGGGLMLVSFRNEVRAPRRAADPPVEAASDRDIDEELKAAREEARSTIEQSETMNEELKAANEEITSVNEELQSTNEELEASKEELQSLNEELSAVNTQLERKIADLEQAGDDMQNLLSGNDVATIFLDTAMRVKWFTPAVRPLFDLIDSDVGRPIVNFAQKFAHGDLVGKATAAMDRLETFEQEVRADNDRTYLLRVLPYRTSDNRIAGVAATFVDVTDLKATQAATDEARAYAEAIVETIRNPLLVLGGDLCVQSANGAFHEMFGIGEAEAIGRSVFALHGGWNLPPLRALLQDMLPKHEQIRDFALAFELPRAGLRHMLLNARRIAGQAMRPERILLALEDVTERRLAARHQQLLVGELSHRVKNTLTVIQSLAAQTLRRSTSMQAFGEAFNGRLQALARAHDAVIEASWLGVGLRAVVDLALQPFQLPERALQGIGPDIVLRPQASLALSMILHELATNALKHGALSVASGRVMVAWRVAGIEPRRKISLTWVESDGPKVVPPRRQGHGVGFVSGSVAHELGGEAKIAMHEAGVHVSIVFPLAPVGVRDGQVASILAAPIGSEQA
jgi:two-component system CheB/CheR fusion protein